MYTIEQIEDAFITALDPLKASLGVRDIKTYQGELDNEDEIAKALKIMPAVLLVYGGSLFADHGNRKLETMKFLLFVCDKNLRRESEARRGGAINPGTYSMLNGVRDLLCNQQAGLINITPVNLVREDPVWFGRGVTVYLAEYETSQELIYKNRTVQTIK